MAAKKSKNVEHSPVEVITAYKGFDQDLKCRGFQYEIGKTYTHAGEVKACEGGFHACEYPLDVFNYYGPASNRFAIVEQSGDLSKHEDDSKVASRVISIKAEIDLHGIIKAAIEYTFSKVKPADPNSPASNSGVRGAASNSGKHGVAAGFGYDNKAMSDETGAIVLVRRSDDGEITHIRASKVGENGIKANVWYSLDENGEFVEAQS